MLIERFKTFLFSVVLCFLVYCLVFYCKNYRENLKIDLMKIRGKNYCKLIREKLIQVADARFDMTSCHLGGDSLEVVVDLDVPDTSLERRPSLQSTDFGQMWMSSDEEWTRGVNRGVLVGISDVRLG